MLPRFSIRFISGDRAGELCPLEGHRLTIGRKPGNSLQISDSSISGSHAELIISESSVILRDRNSTNGTCVGGERIEERELAHGDELRFGSIEALFQDAALTSSAPEGSRYEGDESDAVGSLSAAALEGGKPRSRSGLLVSVALILLLGVGAFFGLSLLEQEGGGASAPVAVFAGDLLSGSGSFEEGLGDWSNDDAASAEFLSTTAAAMTGESGVQAVLIGGERARMVSVAVNAREGSSFSARASFSSDLTAGARLGVLFSGAESSPPSTAWSAVIDGTKEVSFEAITPPGYNKARLVVEALASADGTASVDDAAMISSGSSSGSAPMVGEFGFHLLGSPTQTLCVTKISSVLIGGMEVSGASFEGDGSAQGMELEMSALGVLSFDVSAGLIEGGVASLGDGGFRVHGGDFDREAVKSLLLGKGRDLVALHFDPPCSVRSRAALESARIEAQLAGGRLRVQVDFKEERKQAGDLAYEARGAEREGRLGECLMKWDELLERYPYQEGLVVEAEDVRGRLVQEGLLKIQEVRAEVERASFFRLVELYRSCHSSAVEVGEQYKGSEVEAEAKELIEAVAVELALLEVDLDATEVSRLRSIHQVLVATKSAGLADAVAQYLDSEFSAETVRGDE
jgi:hypothetical protein